MGVSRLIPISLLFDTKIRNSSADASVTGAVAAATWNKNNNERISDKAIEIAPLLTRSVIFPYSLITGFNGTPCQVDVECSPAQAELLRNSRLVMKSGHKPSWIVSYYHSQLGLIALKDT